jgi:16S rRNA processing protein RimM
MASRPTSTSRSDVTPVPGELEVGRVGTAHGVNGEVTISFVSNRAERTEAGTVVHAGERTLVVAAARRHHDKWLVRFVGVDDRDDAIALRGAVLTAAPLVGADVLEPDEYWVHELIGSAVVDVRGTTIGRVVAVEANPAHDLLVLDGGGLVPMPFVVDRRDGAIVVELPEGLLDL